MTATRVQGQWTKADASKKEIETREPIVEDWNPKTGSINSIIELRGYRLYPGGSDKRKVFFIQKGVEFPARTGGGSAVTNDEHNGAQALDVIVPDEVVPGTAEIVVDLDGKRSIPAAITITEWKLPLIKRITPTRGAPGTFVSIEGDGFHSNDEIEVTDADGDPFRIDGGGSSNGLGFGIPEDAPEGIISIRIGNNKSGAYTEPFTFIVTNDPLPLELITSFMKSVAPGQWLDLHVSNDGPLENSERTEVAFKQAGRSIIVAAPKPFRPHVAVPSTLSAGEVELQVRTWRNGRPSEWSDPVVFKLADKPLAPSVGAIRLSHDNWVQLWPGPDRPASLP